MTEVKSLKELNAFIANHNVTLVDFHATWCGPCKRIAPYLTKTAQDNGVPLAKVDVDIASDAAQKYEVKAMPTFKVLDNAGTVLFQKVGGGQENVNQLIKFAKSKL